jgi:hypothetical protein
MRVHLTGFLGGQLLLGKGNWNQAAVNIMGVILAGFLCGKLLL